MDKETHATFLAVEKRFEALEERVAKLEAELRKLKREQENTVEMPLPKKR